MAYKLTVANYDWQASFKRDLLLCHYSLLTLLDRNMPPMEAECLPSCELHSRSLAVGRTGKVHWLLTCVTQSPDCLLNLGILRMHNTISRLCKFSDCAEQIWCTVLVIMHGAVLSLDKAEGEATWPSTMSGDEQWCGYLWTLPTGRLGAARVSHKYMHTCAHAHRSTCISKD